MQAHKFDIYVQIPSEQIQATARSEFDGFPEQNAADGSGMVANFHKSDNLGRTIWISEVPKVTTPANSHVKQGMTWIMFEFDRIEKGVDFIQIWKQRIKKGNIRAFEILYKCYFPSLCLYSYGLIPDEGLVKEIVNDVFLKIWDKRTEIEIQSGIKPYLFRCVHNACLDHMRLKKNLRKYQTTDISDEIRELADPDEEYIFKQIALKKLEEDVTMSIDQLPEKCREIFILSRYELLSYTEISEKLNISVNTVKTQISRALDSLRVSLKKYL